MVNVPLIQGNSIQEINTSIVAIKKAQKELEALNTLVDNKIKALNLALSGGSGKFIQSISQTEGQVAVEVGELTDTIVSGNTQPATSNGVADAINTEATARDNAIASAISDEVTARNTAINNAVVGRLRVISASGQQISGVSSQNDIDFFTNLVANAGTVALTVFPYAWSSNCTVKCFQGNTQVVAFDTNGQAMILINGRCRPNTWDCLTYLVVGGMNSYGSGVCRLIVGTMSYNGGATLTRNCRTF